MSVEKILESTLSTVKERLSSNLVGPFILAWPIINWQVVLVALGDGDYSEKIRYISNCVYESDEDRDLRVLYLPVFFGLFYLIANPVVDLVASSFCAFILNIKLSILLFINKKQPVAREERDVYFSRYNKNVADLEKKISALGEENKLLYGNKFAMDETEKKVKFRFLCQSIAFQCGMGVNEGFVLYGVRFEGQNHSEFNKGRDIGWIKNYRFFNALMASADIIETKIAASRDSSIALISIHGGDFFERLSVSESDVIEFTEILRFFMLISDRDMNYNASFYAEKYAAKLGIEFLKSIK